MVVDYHSFRENKRGICSAYIGKKDKLLGYRGADAIFFYMDKEAEIKAFLIKIGKTDIPVTDLNKQLLFLQNSS